MKFHISALKSYESARNTYVKSRIKYISMKFHEISYLIRIGEGENIEFKSSLSELREIGETACAFLNKGGGTILVGVSDKGRVLGVEVGTRTLERLSNFLIENIKPKPVISINLRAMDNRIIIVIEVPEGSDKPYFFEGRRAEAS